MNFDYEKLVKQSNGRIAVEDLQLLEQMCDFCGARTIVEIGSADGGSSVILGRKARERGGHLYCIEGRPRQKMLDNMRAYNLESYFTLIAKYSPWIDLEDIPNSIDLLFIDGRHDIRWCLVDYHYFERFVRSQGIIVFHDTSGNCQEDKRQPDYGDEFYIPLVRRAIDLILTTDRENLEMIDLSEAPNGGAMAFIKKGTK